MYAAELPDPFPNSEVKRGRADDSLSSLSAKVGSCPLYKKAVPKGRLFCLLKLVCQFWQSQRSEIPNSPPVLCW